MPDMTIAQVSEVAGIPAHRVRYYEARGLVPGVGRDAGGRRVFGDDAVAWLEYVVCLRGLGMPLERIEEYVSAAVTSVDDARRRAVVSAHLEELKARRKELDAYIAAIEAKLDDGGAR